MKRDSKAGKTRAKAARGKVAVKREQTARASAKTAPSPKAVPSPSSDLRREFKDAREQLAATSEVMHLMSGSHGDLARVFKTILAKATRLTQANFGILTLREGDGFRLVATHNAPRAFAELRRREPVIRPAPLIRVAATKQPRHIPDFTENRAFKQGEREAVEFFELTGVRSLIIVPMLKDERVVGTVATYRREVRPFSDRQIELLKTFAAQAVIAIENTRLLKELRESLEGQTATSDILRAIASAPGDVEGSLRKIAETTARQFYAAGVSIRIAEGDAFKLWVGVGQGAEQMNTDLYADPAKRPTVGGRNVPGTVVRENRQVHFPDLDELDPEKANWPGIKVARANGIRTIVGTPLRTKGRAIGALVVYRNVLQPFEPAELQLLQSFADQAVIAIENARLLTELRESLEQQTATSEVLQVISSSPGDLKPVFAKMLENAARICGASFGNIYRWDGEALHLVASHNLPPGYEKIRGSKPFRPSPDSPTGRMIVTKSVTQIDDLSAHRGYRARDPLFVEGVEVGGIRTLLSVPMLKDGELVGAITLYRKEVRPFADKQIALVANFAAQAVIAIENTRLLSELRESLEQQTATADILGVINASRGDLQPVFEAMVEKARRLCDADAGHLALPVGDDYRSVAVAAMSPEMAALIQARSYAPGRGTAIGRALVERRPVQIADIGADEEHAARQAASQGFIRTILGVPLLRQGEPIGAFGLSRRRVEAFTDRQIDLVRTFADQAVIAIENARLFEAEQQRTAELTESLEQQTATSEVLQVISSSPGDLEPVFATMLENAIRICQAQFGVLSLREGTAFRVVAMHNPPPAYAELRRREPTWTPTGLMGRIAAQAVATRQAAQVLDLATYSSDDPLIRLFATTTGARSLILVPLLKESEVIGLSAIYRQEVRPFSDKQVELLTNFAAQAVIAIENTRLLTELRESLEQQTATSKVLEVISRSKFELQPILQSVVDTAARLCRAEAAVIFRLDSGLYRFAAGYSLDPAYLEIERQNPIAPGHGTIVGLAAMNRQVVRIDDAWSDPLYAKKQDAEIGAVRSMIGVPLMREGEPIGVIGLARSRVEPFSEREIDLVATFADQAAIAIENVRLFEAEQQRTAELAESLEQQTAIGEILRVISNSPSDVTPVLATVAEHAARICEAQFVDIAIVADGMLQFAASHGNLGKPLQPIPLDRSSITGRSIVDRQWLQDEDQQRASDDFERGRDFAVRFGHRTILSMPLMREGRALGAILVRRTEVRPFEQKHIALLQTFADQAAIAIENVRLFEAEQQRTAELTESLEQQTATSEVLQVISSSPGDLQPVFDAMLENAARLCQAQFGNLLLYEGGACRMGARYNMPAAFAERFELGTVFHPGPLAPVSRAAATRDFVHIVDLTADEAYRQGDPPVVAVVDLGGARSMLVVPMLKEGEPIGALSIFRREVRPFTDKQIALVENFAAQAVIAIENARLLSELRESLEQQTATSDVLQVISSSPGDLEPVFATMLENATRICQASFGVLVLNEEGEFRIAAMHNVPTAYAELRQRQPTVRLGPRHPLARVAETRQLLHVADARGELPEGDALVELAGARSTLLVPILKEDELIGTIAVYRQEVRPFSDKQIALVEGFAAQAVIAIENTRLLSELRESLEQQTATAEVLSVINASPGDLAPVFDAMVDKALRLCGATYGALAIFEGDHYRAFSLRGGMPEELTAFVTKPVIVPPGSPPDRLRHGEDTVHVRDLGETPPERRTPGLQAMINAGARTSLWVSLRKETTALGFFAIYRTEVRPFSEREIDLVRNFSSQAVIAIENTRLLTELRESLEQQTATTEVLRVISSSPGDLQPVFAVMLEKAAQICDASYGNIYRWDGEALHYVASHNTPEALVKVRKDEPLRPEPTSPLGIAIATKSTWHTADLSKDPAYVSRSSPSLVAGVELGGIRANLFVPMQKEGELVGMFSLFRNEARAFNDKQIDLVQNFAAQAVIAIENTRLLSELRESLEQQTATSKVLEVISSSPGELEPVFAAMLENAVRICDAKFGNIYRLDGELLHFAAAYNTPPALAAERKNVPMTIEQNRLIAPMVATKAVNQVLDAAADPAYTERREPAAVTAVELGGVRTSIAVPMLKDNELIGSFSLYRKEVRPFTDKQIALVAGFASQAVIAIENARLLSELRESLEQQTATAEVLGVISSSPGDLGPVFNEILNSATRICEAKFGVLNLYENGGLRVGAMHNAPPAFAEFLQSQSAAYQPVPGSLLERVILTKEVSQATDNALEAIGRAATLGGARSCACVPMLKDEVLIGTITIFRQEVRPFTDKQIALVTNFAAQAVIAIENARLLSELRERTDELGRSVGELRALGEVSQAVNSTLDLETVLSTIVTKAVQLSNTDAGAIYVFDELSREFHLRATYGMDRELIDALSKQHIGLDESNIAVVMAHRDPVQVADLREDAPNPINEIVLRAGFRARLTAPLLRGEEIVGMLVVRRRRPGAFAPNTVDLIKTFAAQSVLAISNARLFHEIDEKSRELEIAGQHKSQFLANMSHELRTPLNAIIGYSEILQEEAADDRDGALVPDLKKIEGAGRHLLGLINDILDLSKVEAGKMDLFLEAVEIAPLLEEVRALIVPLAEKNGNTLELRLGEHLGTMHTDRTKLKQSLLNILSNGSKFTENGRLTLVAERYGAERPMVRFAVSDTGIGMTEDQLGRLFQAFSQADASTTKKYGGTGLGLAISRQFCQLLGGDIAVTSKPGEGSTFTITLPARSDEPAQISPADAPGVAANGDVTTVLIVDDDAAARELLTANLKGSGYRLIHAKTGEEALQLARSIRPDAITLDVMMPKPDGWEVLSALKADPELADIPVVMVSVAPDRGIGLSLGAVDVLTKPVDRARLTALIHRLVRRDGPVLVVEDDANTREMMRHTIEKLGLATAEAVNGRRALTWLAEHAPPAMILLDLMMPEMDGFEFLDAMSANAQWREIPVVVVTAKALSAAERERLLRQARKVMEKATTTRIEVAVAIAEAVRRRPARAAAGAK